MNDFDPSSRRQVQAALESAGLWLSRSRGQNYLTDRQAIERIVSSVPPDVPVFEVGAGLGALTVPLSKRQEVYALEIDGGVYELLKNLYQSDNLQLVRADFLKFDFSLLPRDHYIFVSNLPYSISGEAVRRFIDEKRFDNGIIMLQDEFVDRVNARPGTPEYGVLAVLFQTYCRLERLFKVGRGSFFPSPTVDSTVAAVSKTGCSLPQDDFALFLRAGFFSRRKKLSNNLKNSGITADDIKKWGFNPLSRPEELSPVEWQDLYRACHRPVLPEEET